MGKKTIITPAGRSVVVDEADIEAAGGAVGHEASQAEIEEVQREQANEELYGGVTGAIATAATNLPGVDIAIRAAGGEAAGEALHQLESRHKIAAIGTQVASGLAGAGLVSKAAKAVTASKIGALGVEGAMFGLQQGAHELSTTTDPLTLERAASVLSSNALLGAGLGVGAGAIGAGASKLAEKGIAKSKAFVDKVRARASIADDLAGLDSKGLRLAEETEKASLQTVRAEAKAAVADEIAGYRAIRDEANPFLVAQGDQRAVLSRTKANIRRNLDNPIGLKEKPELVKKALQEEHEALRKIAAESDGLLAKLAEEDVKLSQTLSKRVEQAAGQVDTFVELDGKLARRYADWSGTKMAKGEKVLAVAPEDATRFQAALDAGEVHGMRAQALGKVDSLLEHNVALQKRIADLDAPLASERLGAISDAREALKAPKTGLEKGLTGYAMGAVTGLLPGGPIGAIGAMLAPGVVRKTADLVLGRLAKASAEAAAGTGKAVETLMAGGKAVGRAVPVAASRVLSEHSFGGAAPKVAKVGRKPNALASYKVREKELLDMVAIGPSGKIEMRPQARLQLGEQLSGVRAVAPLLADRIETVQARKVEFLADKLPKRPDTDGKYGPSRWRPSDMAVAKWARYVDAVENPSGVEDRLARGVVTPGDAEAYRAVFPERYADLQRRIAQQLPQLRQSLPYERQVNLSIFTGIPVASAFQPRTLRRLQSNFASEPGSAGGTQAPRATPNFGSAGSVKSQEMTPSQRREQE